MQTLYLGMYLHNRNNEIKWSATQQTLENVPLMNRNENIKNSFRARNR